MSSGLRFVLVACCAALVSGALVGCTSDPEPAPAPTPTATAAPVAATPEATATPAPPTRTPTPVATPTPTPEPTATPTPTPEPTATPVPVDTALDAALPFDPAVVRGTLSNGLAYYIRQNEEPRDRAQLWLVVKAGSVLEEEAQRGLAHFVEHMAFNGTERFAKHEIIEYLESIGSTFGPDVNAQTGFDSTLYFLEIPTDDPEILETAFEILSDWAYAITLSPEEVELERGVILEEWRLFQGFSSRFQTSLLPLLFGSSRYADRAPIGLTEVIENAPVEQLRAYYERWYRPDLMAVVAVGDFDAALIEGKVRQYFAPAPEGEAMQPRAAVAPPTERPSFGIPDHDAPRVSVFTDPEAPVTQVTLVRRVLPETGQDVAALRRVVVEELAFMMLNARLFERGQSPDPPYLLSATGRSPFAEPTDILTFAVLVEQDGVESGFVALLEELQRVRQHGFTNAELEREKSNLLRSIESVYLQRDQQPSAGLAFEYTDHFLSGTPAPGIEAEWQLYQALLPEILLADVDQQGASWTAPGNTVLLVLGPEAIDPSGGDELASVLEAQLAGADALVVEPYAETFDDVPLLAMIPTPGSIVEEEEIESIEAVRWTLSNGVTVIAKQTDFRSDEVQFTAFSPGGSSLVADADHVSAQYASALASGSGVGLHDSVALDRLLAGKRVSVSPYISELFEGLSGSASPEDLETLFQLITLYVTEARLDPDYFSTYEARLRSAAEVRPTQPDTVLFDRVNTLLAQEHLRRRPLSLELIEELSLDRAQAVYLDRFADLGDATFVFVGAFEWDALRSLAATYLANLPTAGRAEQWRDVDVDPPPGIADEVVRSGIEPRSNTVWVFAGDAEWSGREVLALDVAGEMLQTRLRERVREQLGGTYSIGVQTIARRLPDHEYLLAIIFGSDPARVEELVAEVTVELDWIRGGGEQQYLDTVKEQLRSSREEQLRENGFWLSQIQGATQRGESLEEINRFDEWLDAITLEDVAAAGRRYLPEDRYVRVVLRPEEE